MEAIYSKPADAMLDYTPAEAAVSAGEVIQHRIGIGCAAPVDITEDVLGAIRRGGLHTVKKTASIALLTGARVFWDHSANTATYKKVADRDFYIGRCAVDSSESETIVQVIFGIDPVYDVDLARDGFQSVVTGTAAAGGLAYPQNLGGSLIFELTSTNEAQCVDALSVDGFAYNSNPIIEGCFRIMTDGSNATQDFNIGIANETHASNADTIAESVFIHVDGNSTNIAAECDDGTNETAATDTTADYTEGTALASRVFFTIDMRNPADVQIYVNGALVLAATTFSVTAKTGTWFLLVHLEKSSSTDVYKVGVDYLRAYLAQE